MRDDVSDIIAMYNSDTNREHVRLVRHQLEFDITMHFLAKYIKPGQSVLEIGCATGRYTLELLRRGVKVTAVDFSSKMIAHSKRYLRTHGFGNKVTHYLSDARDLSALPDTTYDAVLLMGPLYHLVELSDRELALRQAAGKLKRRGLVVSSFISRYGIFGDIMKKVPQWIEEKESVTGILARGRDPEDYPKGGFRGYFAAPTEIPRLHEQCGFKTLEMVAAEPGISADDASYNCLGGKRRSLWLKLLLSVASEPSTIGASRHLLYVGRKAR